MANDKTTLQISREQWELLENTIYIAVLRVAIKVLETYANNMGGEE